VAEIKSQEPDNRRKEGELPPSFVQLALAAFNPQQRFALSQEN
jgi:hypothetical protein